MNIIYPDNFIKFYNDDDEIVEVGEFEVLDFDYNNNYYDDSDYYSPDSISNSYRLKVPDPISNLPSTLINIPGVIYDNLKPSSFRPPQWPLPPFIGPPQTGPGPVIPGQGGSPSQMGPGPVIPGQGGGPPGPPPAYIPAKTDQQVKSLQGSGGPGIKAVSPDSVKFCLYRFTYIWQTNGRSYWAYLVRVDRRSISGFRWAGWRWVYFGVDTRRIDSFVCY